jgi:hypothetical protein
MPVSPKNHSTRFLPPSPGPDEDLAVAHSSIAYITRKPPATPDGERHESVADETVVDEEESRSDRHTHEQRYRRIDQAGLRSVGRERPEAGPRCKQEADTEGDAKKSRDDRLGEQRDYAIDECRRQRRTPPVGLIGT